MSKSSACPDAGTREFDSLQEAQVMLGLRLRARCPGRFPPSLGNSQQVFRFGSARPVEQRISRLPVKQRVSRLAVEQRISPLPVEQRVSRLLVEQRVSR